MYRMWLNSCDNFSNNFMGVLPSLSVQGESTDQSADLRVTGNPFAAQQGSSPTWTNGLAGPVPGPGEILKSGRVTVRGTS